ncbi:MAG: hypothetical protein ABW162_03975 [Candidatus Sedimenticola sp. PURPLELP]
MKRIVVLLLIGLLIPSLAAAWKYRQPAYISNAYFCNEPQKVDGFVQPDRVFNKLKANDPLVVAHLVLNMVAGKGQHVIEVDILNSHGKIFDTMKFQPVEAVKDNWTYTATGRFGGALPSGGLFFKIYNRHDNGARVELDTLRLMTVEW